MTIKHKISKHELYEKLEDYYLNNSLFEEVLENFNYRDFQNNEIISNNYKVSRKDGMRNPINRAIEFYASKVISGEMNSIKIESDNQSAIDAINQTLVWSNFAGNKQKDIRHLALYGNLFYKAMSTDSKVWFEEIDGKNVTKFKEDSRGYLTEIRIDTPIYNELNNLVNRVEYWNKKENVWKIWTGNTTPETPINQLGTPDTMGNISSLGIDFIPIVHVKFHDVGYPEGVSAVYHVFTKVEEANRQATRLHQILFRYGKPTTVISSNAEGTNGEPLAAPLVDSTDYIAGDTEILALPGKATVSSLIPDIDFSSALAVLQAQISEIENDLPELAYYKLTENNVSGKSLKLQMGSAIDRAEECRNNFIAGFTRIVQMCMTLGQFWGLFSVGSYEKGDLDFSVQFPEMFPMDIQDISNVINQLTQAGLALSTALRLAGYSEDFITQALEEQSTEQTNKSKADLTAFNQF